jgi:hypothetical protein
MRVASEGVLARLIGAAPAVTLRASCAALLFCVSGCGGGSDGAPPPSPTSTPALTPTPDTTQPPPEPAQRVVGTAVSIDGGATGDPFNLRVARSANGDGFAVWLAAEGSRANLWANRYRAGTAAWGSPISITRGTDINDFDLAVDPSGNAVVVWHENADLPPPQFGRVLSARFDADAGVWTTPLLLNASSYLPRVAADASGAVLAVYAVQQGTSAANLPLVVRGRFLDPVSGTWLPEAAIAQDPAGIVQYNEPVALLDGSGNALVASFDIGSVIYTTTTAVASNYYSRSSGSWGLGMAVPGSLVSRPVSIQGGLDGRMELAASTDGNFLLAWSSVDFSGATIEGSFPADIHIAQFTSRTRKWSAPQMVVSGNEQQRVRLQRMRSDASGNAHLLWTENDGMRTTLKALRLDRAGAACEAVQVIDSAVGRNAWRADLAVDPLGDAVAIWQQFEGRLPDEGGPEDRSRSNIAINRFDRATARWDSAVLAETQPGDAISPRASANSGQALLGWIQAEGGANRVKALLQPLTNTPGQ